MEPDEPENFAHLDASELRKDSVRIVEALVNSEADVQLAWLEDEYVDSRTVVSLYHAMLCEGIDASSVGDSFVRILVHDALLLAKEAPELFDGTLLPIARLLGQQPPHPETRAESHRTVCELVTEIWAAYLQDVVQARPAPPDLKMSTLAARDCSCGDCRQINSFLADQNPSTRYVFRGSERRRRHVKTELRAVHGNALSLKTENTGTPHALVINKILDHLYRDERQAWEARVRKAKQQLRQCPHLIQGSILGPSFFTALPRDAMEQILAEFIVPPAAIELPAPAPLTDANPMLDSGNATSAGPAKRSASDELVDPTERKRLVGSEGME
jgi:hypothetical protein